MRRKSKKRKKVFITLLVATLISLCIYFGVLQGVVRLVSMPFLYTIEGVKNTASVVQSSFIPESVLLEENRILQERISTLERQLVFNEEQDFFSDEDVVRADVLIRPSQNVYGTLLLRKDDGNVSVGDVVVTREGAFMGVVDEVQASLVKVTLSSHPGFSQEVSVERSGIPVTAVGVGAGNMKAELAQGADIEKSDVLVDLASGRIVAEVGEVVVSDANAFITVYMRMPVNVFEITEVFITPSVQEE